MGPDSPMCFPSCIRDPSAHPTVSGQPSGGTLDPGCSKCELWTGRSSCIWGLLLITNDAIHCCGSKQAGPETLVSNSSTVRGWGRRDTPCLQSNSHLGCPITNRSPPSDSLTDLSISLLRPPCDRSTGLQAAPDSPTGRSRFLSSSPGLGGWVLGLG